MTTRSSHNRTLSWLTINLVIFCVLEFSPVAVAQPDSIEDAEALNQRVAEHYGQGRYSDAIPLAKRALAITEKVLGFDHADTAWSLDNLASLYQYTGSYGQAEPLFQRALAIRERVFGQDHPAVAASLNNLALLYQYTEAYAKAEPLLKRALAIQEKVVGLEHPDTAGVLNNFASLYQATGAYAQAEPLLKRALAIMEKVLGPEHPAVARALNNLASLYQDAGHYEQAEPLYQRALVIKEKVLGPEHPGTATSLDNLATLYRRIAAYAQAEPLFQRALAIREKVLGPEHPGTATSLDNLATLYHRTAAYAQAEPLFQRALAIREKVLGSVHSDVAISLNNLASLYQATGAYAQAEPLLKRALAIQEKVLGPEHPAVARALNNLATLYDHRGAYTQVEPLLQRALAIQEKVLGSEHPDTAQTLNALALLYQATGAYAQAEPLLKRALAIQEKVLGPEHPDTAGVLNNLALLYQATGAYAQAEPLLKRALAIQEKVLGPEHPAVARALNNLATLYDHRGAYTQVEPLLQRALAIQEKVLGSEHPDTAQTINALALLYQATGAYAQAEQFYQRAHVIAEKMLGGEHPHTGWTIENLAYLHWATGDLSKAQSLKLRAQAISEKNLATFLLSESESRGRSYLQRLLGSTFANVTFSLLDHQATDLGLRSVLQTKGRLLDAVSESIGRLRRSVRPEDRRLFEQLTEVVQGLSVLTYQGLGTLKPETYRQRIQQLTSRKEQLEAELSARSTEFRQRIAPVTLAAVQAKLPKNAALVEWYRYRPVDPRAKDPRSRLGKPRYAAYVFRHERSELVAMDIGEAETIERVIQDFRTGLSDPKSTYVQEVARELYHILLKPLQQHLNQVDQLLISPDGALNLVPFAALRDEWGQYVASKVSITYLTSGRDLVRFEGKSGGKGKAVIVANPAYGQPAPDVAKLEISVQASRSVDLDRGGMVFAPLLGTAGEAKRLKALLKVRDDNVFTQAKATEDRIKRLHSPHILHVATHGFFLKANEVPTAALSSGSISDEKVADPVGENPLLRSGLALAGANVRRSGEKDDGILTAAEVAQMDLRGTQLVVLSACETGVGDVQNGEGVYGLRRALVLAGAETQVTSLWKVADDATKDLMVDYYKRLLKGEGRSEALRNTQLTMMKSKDRSHPYYWAAFVPIGDWRPLSRNR